MSWDDKLTYLVIGCIIGFIFGRISVRLHTIEEEVHESNELARHDHPDYHTEHDRDNPRDERGSIELKNWKLKDYALLFVVLLVAYSAFASQKASNDAQDTADKLVSTQSQLQDTQARLLAVTSCTEQYLNSTIVALNERTTYTVAQGSSNVDLVNDQLAFLEILLGPPPATPSQGEAAAQKYIASAEQFVHISRKAAAKIKNNPYPAKDALDTCVDARLKEAKPNE